MPMKLLLQEVKSSILYLTKKGKNLQKKHLIPLVFLGGEGSLKANLIFWMKILEGRGMMFSENPFIEREIVSWLALPNSALASATRHTSLPAIGAGRGNRRENCSCLPLLSSSSVHHK